MNFYPLNRRPLDERAFRQPGAEYRGAPFWSWNDHLRLDALRRQIRIFKQMGFGGFQMHARTGLSVPYLGAKFMDLIRKCTEEAADKRMLAWLYDEDRWPSGFAGGLVTKNSKHRMKYLLFTRIPYSGVRRPPPNRSNALVGREENGTLLARYAIKLESSLLARYQRLKEGERLPKGTTEWFAYAETVGPVPWFNHQGYADLLDSDTTRRFIEVTHERFKSSVGSHFGRAIPAIFTDEPQHAFKSCFEHADQRVDLTVPITDTFFKTYRKRYGDDLLDKLPEVFWETSATASVARYRYHDHVTDRFSQAFAAVLGQWCQLNGLMLTGHMMEEPTLFSQTRAVGEAMRSLAHFHLPGIDMLCDRMELTTAKQAQSVSRQQGRAGVMSELYGVTGWDFDFVGHKAQGDWQAALGVTVRVPHLAWVSMAGEAKRDYPASINYQSPWYREYKLIEDHFARVNVVLTRGRPVVRIGVIHPIESYWLCYGPLAQTKEERELRDRQFTELPSWLLGSLLDFDYISEALLPSQVGQDFKHGFKVGRMSYDVIVVPSVRTLRSTTVDALERYVEAGGEVIFAGEVPSLVDAAPSTRSKQLAAKATRCKWDKVELVCLLDAYRDIDCTDTAGIRARELFYQLRQDGTERHLFLCHLNRKVALPGQQVRLRGSWIARLKDTATGCTCEIETRREGSHTVIPLEFTAHGHALITLRRGKSHALAHPRPMNWQDAGELSDPVRISLSEPNVLLLNQAEWRWNDEPWQPQEEILRLDNLVRARCGLPPHEGEPAQPWTDDSHAPALGRVSLRIRINTQIKLKTPILAIEEPLAWSIQAGRHTVSARPSGWWVDEAIRQIKLPDLSRGEHIMTLSRNYTRKTRLEWVYLLGDFGVMLSGRHVALSAPVRKLSFGDWTRQGLPFYAGNVTYHCVVNRVEHAPLALHFPRFSAPLLRVSEKGGGSAPVAFAPFRYHLKSRKGDSRSVAITAYGNRHNAFGPLHNIDPNLTWIGPDAWRSTGDHWTYEYQLKPMGLLAAPRLQIGSFHPIL